VPPLLTANPVNVAPSSALPNRNRVAPPPLDWLAIPPLAILGIVPPAFVSFLAVPDKLEPPPRRAAATGSPRIENEGTPAPGGGGTLLGATRASAHIPQNMDADSRCGLSRCIVLQAGSGVDGSGFVRPHEVTNCTKLPGVYQGSTIYNLFLFIKSSFSTLPPTHTRLSIVHR